MVPADKVEEKALEIAGRLSGYDIEALKITKKSLWRIQGMTAEQAQHYVWDVLARFAASEHGQKSIQAFRNRVEKRTGLSYTAGETGPVEKGESGAGGGACSLP